MRGRNLWPPVVSVFGLDWLHMRLFKVCQRVYVRMLLCMCVLPIIGIHCRFASLTICHMCGGEAPFFSGACVLFVW